MIICPGGAYRTLAFNKEGTEIADWLNAIGVTGIVLKYRVPRREGLQLWEAPLQDAQRAIGIVRSRSAEWGIDPTRIGMIGFSAGGHLSAAASTNYEARTYPRVDDTDDVSSRPDFAMIIYPGYLTKNGGINELSEELPVNEKTPPTILIQTADDSARVENSVGYFMALKRASVPVEMHLYPSGGHGYGLRPSEHDISSWPDRCHDFLKSQGILKKL